jgi:hypothetical protein
MKVKDLIRKLKKMPKDSDVAFQDHDQDAAELNNFVNNVELVDFNEFDDTENYAGYEGEIVVLKG